MTARCTPLSDGGWSFEADVADTGRGMTDEGLANLFRPFQQADESVARTHGGTGLGLSIARQLAQLMGGDVTATSRLDQGSRFAITLRLADASEALESEPAPSSAADVDGVRILAADDHEINRRVLAIQLDAMGADVIFASDGQEAVELLSGIPFDVALLDVHMPKMSGPDVARATRAGDGPNRRIPMIATTGADDEGVVRACIDAGMIAHVVKPIDPARLLAAISGALEASAAGRDDTPADSRLHASGRVVS